MRAADQSAKDIDSRLGGDRRRPRAVPNELVVEVLGVEVAAGVVRLEDLVQKLLREMRKSSHSNSSSGAREGAPSGFGARVERLVGKRGAKPERGRGAHRRARLDTVHHVHGQFLKLHELRREV